MASPMAVPCDEMRLQSMSSRKSRVALWSLVSGICMKLVPAKATRLTRSAVNVESRLVTSILLRCRRLGCMSSAIIELERSRQMAMSLPLRSPFSMRVPIWGLAMAMMRKAIPMNRSAAFAIGRQPERSGMSRPYMDLSAHASSRLRERQSSNAHSPPSAGITSSSHRYSICSK